MELKKDATLSLIFWIANTILIFFSTIILAYTSMSTGFGPFIAPTIILLTGLFFSIFLIKNKEMELWLFFLQQGASLAGLTATAIGFIFPTFYFLDKDAFLKLTSSFFIFVPLIFCITTLALLWGNYWGALFFRSYFKNHGNFSVPQMLNGMIIDIESGLERYFFAGGFLSCILTLGKSFLIKIQPLFLATQFYPSMVAVGFSLGFKNIKTFLFGYFFRYCFLIYFPIFTKTSVNFCTTSGIVAAILFLDIITSILMFFIKTKTMSFGEWFFKSISFLSNNKELKPSFKDLSFIFILFLLILFGAMKLNLSIVAYVFVLLCSIPIIFKASEFAVEFGLLPFGRFATFVMLPVFLCFNLSGLALVAISLFVAIACAGAVNYLFNHKLASFLDIPLPSVSKNQLISIFMTSTCSALVFLLLFQKFQLGSQELFAQRGLSRAMLLKSFNINYVDFFVGGLIFILLKFFKMSEMVFFNTLLMPPTLSGSLFFGSLISRFIKHSRSTDFFSVGVFAGESILTLILLLI